MKKFSDSFKGEANTIKQMKDINNGMQYSHPLRIKKGWGRLQHHHLSSVIESFTCSFSRFFHFLTTSHWSDTFFRKESTYLHVHVALRTHPGMRTILTNNFYFMTLENDNCTSAFHSGVKWTRPPIHNCSPYKHASEIWGSHCSSSYTVHVKNQKP